MRFFFVGCLFVLGCKDPTKDFEALADRACQCAENDAACGAKVLSDLVTFTEHTKYGDGNQSRLNAAGVRISNCLVESGVNTDKVTAALEKMVK